MKTVLEHSANGVFFLLGTMHTVLTLVNQRPFDLDALMYVGAGLAFIFLSLFNFARVKSTERLTKLLSFVANLLITLYITLIAIVFADPRVAIAIVVLLVLVVLSFLDYQSSAN